VKLETDYIRKKYSPLLAKNLRHAIAHKLGKEFPRLGGKRILDLCAEMIIEVINAHLQPLDNIKHGQALWMAVSVNDPPRMYQQIANTDLIPVLLDLSTPQDIQAILDRTPAHHRLQRKAIRLCYQAYQQGALLSNCDLAELLCYNDSVIASAICSYEKEHQKVVPRRATLHDVGSGLTHKRIICYKRYAEGKSQEQIARETHHSLEAVDNYLGQYDRVRLLRKQGNTEVEIAFTLNRSLRVIRQYLEIDDELQNQQN
jgi:DNA-binding CsgD family transcriptional regulator